MDGVANCVVQCRTWKYITRNSGAILVRTRKKTSSQSAQRAMLTFTDELIYARDEISRLM